MSVASIQNSQSFSQTSQTAKRMLADQVITDGAKINYFNEKFTFPLFSEMIRSTKLHSVICVFALFLLFIQSYQLFPIDVDVYYDKSLITENNEAIFYFTSIIYFVFNLFYFIFLFAYYRLNHFFTKWQVNVTLFILSFFNIILFSPLCAICGYSISRINHVVVDNQKLAMAYNIISHNPNLNLTSNLGNISFTSKLIEESAPQNGDFQVNIDQKQTDLLSNSDFNISIVWCFFLLLEICYIYCQIILSNHFLNDSPYLNRSLLGMWDVKMFNIYLFALGVSSFCTFVIPLFRSWIRIVAQLFLIFFNVYILYLSFLQPFFNRKVSSFFSSMLTMNIAHILIALVRSFYKPDRGFVFAKILGPLLIFLISLLIYKYLQNKLYTSIHNKLSPPKEDIVIDEQGAKPKRGHLTKKQKERKKQEEYFKQQIKKISDEEKRQIFDSFVFQNEDHALLYLRIGVSMASPFIIDFSFIRYLKENYDYNRIRYMLLRISALLPSQQQFFAFCMKNLLDKDEFMDLYQRFVLHQLRRIHIIRQATMCAQIQRELIPLQKMTDESISAVRSFWAEILQVKSEINATSLDYIKKKTNLTKYNYIDVIERYPNSLQLLNNYCRFLCEACGDFKECAKVGQKMRLIEQGKSVVTDLCYQSFVNTFPHYLKYRILDVKGSVIVNTAVISQQSSTSLSSERISSSSDNVKKYLMNSPSSQNKFQSKLSMDQLFEQDQYESLLNSLFPHGRLRICIQSIMDKTLNPALTVARLISNTQLIIYAAFLIVFTIILSYLTKSPLHMIESSTITSNIVSSLQYSSMIAGIQYLESLVDGKIYEYILHNLSIGPQNLPRTDCSFINPIRALNARKITIAEKIDQELKLIMSSPNQHLDEIRIYNQLDIPDQFGVETQSLHSNSKIKNFPNTRHFKQRKKSSIEDITKLSINETFDYYKDSINAVILNTNQNGDINLDYNYNQSGIYIFKTVGDELFGYPIPLRNGLEYFQAVVSRLGYEQSIRASPTIPNSTRLNDNNISCGFQNYTEEDIITLRELHVNGYILAIPFYNLFGVLSNNGRQLSDDLISSIQAISSIIITIMILAFPIRRFYNYYYIKQSFELNSEILNIIKKKDISKVFKPIYLKYKQGLTVKSITTQSIHESSPSMFLYPFFLVLSSVVFAVISAALILQFTNAFTYISDSYQLSSQSTRRFWSFLQMFNCLICEKTGIFNFNIFEKISETAYQIFLASQLLDLTVIKKDPIMSSFYFTVNDSADDINYQLNQIIDTMIEPQNVLNKFNEKHQPIIKLTSKGYKKLKNTRTLNLRSNRTLNIRSNRTITKSKAIPKAEQTIYTEKHSNFTCSSINVSDLSDPYNVARYLDCISINNRVNLGINYLMLIDSTLQNRSLIEIPEFLSSLYLIDAHLFTDLSDYQAKLTDSFVTTIDTMTNNIIIIVISGIIILIIVFICEYLSLKNLENSFNAFKQLIMILPPKIFVTTPCLSNFLAASCQQSFTEALKRISKTKSKAVFNSSSFLNNDVLQGRVSLSDHIVQSQEEILIHNLNDAIVIISREMLIEFVNPALEKITGHSAYQILGQNIMDLIPACSAINNPQRAALGFPFYQRLDEVMSNTGKKMIEVNANCPTDKGEDKIVRASIIGIYENRYSSENEETTEVCIAAAIIFKDIAEELRQKELVKKSKQITEAMLKSILPPMILDDLETSKKDILYSVNKATLIKFQITGYDYYINTMMPKDLIAGLNMIYSTIKKIRHSENPILLGQHGSTTIQDHDNFRIAFDAFTITSDTTTKSFFTNTSTKSSNNQHENDDDFQSSSIYNLRNDNDCLIYVCGLFDNQEKYDMQAESCVKFALKVKKVIEEASETINIYLHVRIAIVMGGPIECYVSNPQMPKLAFLSELLNKADDIRRHYNQDDIIYVNQEVATHLNHEKFSIEEATLQNGGEPVYTVDEYLNCIE